MLEPGHRGVRHVQRSFADGLADFFKLEQPLAGHVRFFLEDVVLVLS